MNLYHAFLGPGDRIRAVPILTRTEASSALVSYAYLPNLDSAKEYFDQLRVAGAKRIFLDSGAFTAWNSGGEIDMGEYARAVGTLKPDVYVQLDVIGDAKGTRRNLEIMREAGLKPIPVFTRGAAWEDLRRLLDEGEDYICLGNIAKARTGERLEWCHGVFSVVAAWRKETKTTAIPRFHAFGVTEPEVLFAFPFYSADSSSALMQAVFGRVLKYDRLKRKMQSVNVNERANGWRCPDGIDVGVTEARTRPQAERAVANAVEMETMRRDVTASWVMRGVAWDD